MDFMNRNGQSQQSGRVAPSGPATPQPSAAPVHNASNGNNEEQHEKRGRFIWAKLPMWVRAANVVLLFSVTVLAIAIASLLYNSNPSESKYVDTNKYQAVFLENGQVYFGKLASVNTKSLNLKNIFYLNSQSQSQTDKTTTANDKFTLIKLGCELHGPYDQMIINRDQVTFWENLKDDGQVVKTIKEWIKQNPNGQSCSTSTNSTDQSTTDTSNATGTGANATTNSTTTNSSSTTTKKP